MKNLFRIMSALGLILFIFGNYSCKNEFATQQELDQFDFDFSVPNMIRRNTSLNIELSIGLDCLDMVVRIDTTYLEDTLKISVFGIRSDAKCAYRGVVVRIIQFKPQQYGPFFIVAKQPTGPDLVDSVYVY